MTEPSPGGVPKLLLAASPTGAHLGGLALGTPGLSTRAGGLAYCEGCCPRRCPEFVSPSLANAVVAPSKRDGNSTAGSPARAWQCALAPPKGLEAPATQFWQRRTNIWREATNPARPAKRLRGGMQNQGSAGSRQGRDGASKCLPTTYSTIFYASAFRLSSFY